MNHEERITKIIKLNLQLKCDCSNANILVKGTITVAPATAAAPINANKKEIFKNCASFTIFISRIKNPQIDDAHDNDLVMSMYNLTECSDNYSNISGLYSNIGEMNRL